MTDFETAALRLSAALGGGRAADMAARALIEADLLGVPRFGLAMLDEWSPECRPLPAFETGAALAFADVSSQFSPLAVAEAVLHLEQVTPRRGVAAVFLRGVKGVGRLVPFLRHLADQGLVGLAGAEGPPFVAPHGGRAPVIGTNPIAFAMGRGDDRVVIDAASSAATMAEIKSARHEGRRLAPGLAYDRSGAPTLEAAEVAALLPRDGQIGSLLGLIVELLAGVAGGGRGDPRGRGVFLLALDPGQAEGAPHWAEKLGSLRQDWLAGGGHWPKGGGVLPETPLSPEIQARLDAYIARLRA